MSQRLMVILTMVAIYKLHVINMQVIMTYFSYIIDIAFTLHGAFLNSKWPAGIQVTFFKMRLKVQHHTHKTRNIQNNCVLRQFK